MNVESIRKAAPGETVWDKGDRNSVSGLHVRVSATGKKTFLVYYRTKAGVQRRPKIGDFGELTLAEARKRAKKITDMVAVGEDPKAEWDEAKAELTVKELYDKVLKEYWDKPRFRASDRLRDVKSLWKNHLEPNFGTLKLSAVTVVVLRKWHSSLSERPYAANRSMEVLSRMFTYAEEVGLRSQGTNPCNLVPAHQEKKRKRYATPEEIKQIGVILEREFEAHPNGVVFLYLLLTTGSRPRAIERATWDQLQPFEKEGQRYGVLTFHGKSSATTGEDEVVILPPQAMAMLDRIPRTSDGTLTNCKMPAKLWKKIRDEVGCDDLWARDFRRTFATVGLSNGVGLSQIGELLNHKSAQTTKVYGKLMDNERVAAATSIASKVIEIMAQKDSPAAPLES